MPPADPSGSRSVRGTYHELTCLMISSLQSYEEAKHTEVKQLAQGHMKHPEHRNAHINTYTNIYI